MRKYRLGNKTDRADCENAGTFRFHCTQIFISNALKKKWIGLEEIDDGICAVYFYDVLLARFDERDQKLHA